MNSAPIKQMPSIVLPIPEAEPEFEMALTGALAKHNGVQMIAGQAINWPATAFLHPTKVILAPGSRGNAFDPAHDAYLAAKKWASCPSMSVGRCIAGGGAPQWIAHDPDMVMSHNFHRHLGVGAQWLSGHDPMEGVFSDMLLSVLVDVSKVDRYVAPIEHNAPSGVFLELFPRTTDCSTELDEREVAILESKQQRDAILVSKDFRATLQTLVDEEQFSNHDLTQIIGVTRAVLVTWRDRPLEKIRQVNHAALGRLLFAWKYWLHVTEGELLGRYLRQVPEQCATSLLRLLADHEPTEDEIARHVDRLAIYAAADRKAAALRRRDLGGLPVSAYKRDVAFD